MKNLYTDMFLELTCPSCKTNLFDDNFNKDSINRDLFCKCEKTKVTKGRSLVRLKFDNFTLCYLNDSDLENTYLIQVSYSSRTNKEFNDLIKDNFKYFGMKNITEVIINNKETYIEQIQWLINTYYKLKINEIFI